MAISLRLFLILGSLALISGCVSHQLSTDAPSAATTAANEVLFLKEAPPGAKFIAKVPYSSASSTDWQMVCGHFLANKAVELGGNVVVPGIELDYGSHQLAVGDPRFNPIHPPVFVRTVNSNGEIVMRPGKFHFWSAIYYYPN